MEKITVVEIWLVKVCLLQNKAIASTCTWEDNNLKGTNRGLEESQNSPGDETSRTIYVFLPGAMIRQYKKIILLK